MKTEISSLFPPEGCGALFDQFRVFDLQPINEYQSFPALLPPGYYSLVMAAFIPERRSQETAIPWSVVVSNLTGRDLELYLIPQVAVPGVRNPNEHDIKHDHRHPPPTQP